MATVAPTNKTVKELDPVGEVDQSALSYPIDSQSGMKAHFDPGRLEGASPK
jgi:hypothetical protein